MWGQLGWKAPGHSLAGAHVADYTRGTRLACPVAAHWVGLVAWVTQRAARSVVCWCSPVWDAPAGPPTSECGPSPLGLRPLAGPVHWAHPAPGTAGQVLTHRSQSQWPIWKTIS